MPVPSPAAAPIRAVGAPPSTDNVVVGASPSAQPENGRAAAVRPAGGAEQETWFEQWRLVVAAVSCWTSLLVAFAIDRLASAPHAAVLALYGAAYLAGGTFAARTAFRDLARGHVNVDLLMITAAIGAASVNAWAEGAVLLGLFSTSNALEHHALERTRQAVRSLMDLSPDVATVLRPDLPGGEAVVPVDTLALGDLVLIRPGERVPVDGVVVTGESEVDQAAITGESVPVGKRAGNPVFAATMNVGGALEVRVTKLATESMLAKIIGFVEEAREQKSATQNFTDRFEGRYAVGVIVASALVALVPWLVFGWNAGDAFYRAMALLVVASPCALVISTPASTLSALANAARNGILFKGGNHLENAGVVQIVAFDKTSTLTRGEPDLTDVVALPGGWAEDELLALAAAAERLSEHPIAQAIVRGAAGRGLTIASAADFRAIPGKGIVARVDGREIAIGNEALFADLGVPVDPALPELTRLRDTGRTAMLVGDRSAVRGIVAVADTLRPQAAGTIRALRTIGVETVMLTGDNRRVADAIAAQLGIADVRADLLPEQKLTTIRDLLVRGKVAMVGDGVNDAPALATATLGVAMGGAGTDVALETADVVLMADDLSKLPYAIALSRRTRAAPSSRTSPSRSPSSPPSSP